MNHEPVFFSVPSGPEIARWFIEEHRAGRFHNVGGGATWLCKDPICTVWALAEVDHDEQTFHLLDVHTGDSHDLLFVTAGLREKLSCEWRQEPSRIQSWGYEGLDWFASRIEFAEEHGPPLVWMPDLSNDSRAARAALEALQPTPRRTER